MLASATACKASITTSSLWSFCHLQHQHFLSLNYCRIQHPVLTLLCPLGQVLTYLNSLSTPKEKAKNKRHLVLPYLEGWFGEHFVFQQVQGMAHSWTKNWDGGRRLRFKSPFLCFLLLPLSSCLLWVWNKLCVWLGSTSSSIHCCTLLSSGTAAESRGEGRVSRAHPGCHCFYTLNISVMTRESVTL